MDERHPNQCMDKDLTTQYMYINVARGGKGRESRNEGLSGRGQHLEFLIEGCEDFFLPIYRLGLEWSWTWSLNVIFMTLPSFREEARRNAFSMRTAPLQIFAKSDASSAEVAVVGLFRNDSMVLKPRMSEVSRP